MGLSETEMAWAMMQLLNDESFKHNQLLPTVLFYGSFRTVFSLPPSNKLTSDEIQLQKASYVYSESQAADWLSVTQDHKETISPPLHSES